MGLAGHENKYCEAKINGKIIHYNFCSKDKNAYNKYKNIKLEYLGKGDIYSVDGIVQSGNFGPYHFWIKVS